MLWYISTFGTGDEVSVFRMYRVSEANGQLENVVALSCIYGLRWLMFDAPFDRGFRHIIFQSSHACSTPRTFAALPLVVML
jgi:hypothetical protein